MQEGNLMYLADHLSIAPLDQENEGKEPNEFQVFATELESMSPLMLLSCRPRDKSNSNLQFKTQF